MNPSTNRGWLECAQTMRRAIEIARHICSGIHENSSEDTIVTTDRFFIDLHFEGRCRGSEPISYGWTKDFDPPHLWVLRGLCKTGSADDPIRAHLLVSHIGCAGRSLALSTPSSMSVATCRMGTCDHSSASRPRMRYRTMWTQSRDSFRLP